MKTMSKAPVKNNHSFSQICGHRRSGCMSSTFLVVEEIGGDDTIDSRARRQHKENIINNPVFSAL